MDLFHYHPMTDKFKNLAHFQIFNIAKIDYVLRAVCTKVTL